MKRMNNNPAFMSSLVQMENRNLDTDNSESSSQDEHQPQVTEVLTLELTMSELLAHSAVSEMNV